MHFRPRTWAALSLLFLFLAIVFWRLAQQAEQRYRADKARTNATATIPRKASQPFPTPSPAPAAALPSPSPPDSNSKATAGQTNAAQAKGTNAFPHRLSNTTLDLDTLLRSDRALLLRNALLDTTAGTTLPIPAHLRATGDPGAYVVQARGVITY